jgi:ArsR family transcriptional regulator, lead/cadmium/zinc/bismuth-responsive transcriptional repressor
MDNGNGAQVADRCEIVLVDEARVRAVEATLVDGLTATHMAETFQALSDPTRVRIISALAQQELCVCDLAAVLGMSQSAISHQLRLLRVMSLVRHRKEGRMVYYALDDEHIHRLFREGLEHALHG